MTNNSNLYIKAYLYVWVPKYMDYQERVCDKPLVDHLGELKTI